MNSCRDLDKRDVVYKKGLHFVIDITSGYRMGDCPACATQQRRHFKAFFLVHRARIQVSAVTIWYDFGALIWPSSTSILHWLIQSYSSFGSGSATVDSGAERSVSNLRHKRLRNE